MVARTTKRKATIRAKTPSVKADLVVDKPTTKPKSRFSFKQKLIISGIVLVVAYVLFSSKELFVAATVNGQPITRLKVLQELEKQGGQQTLDSLVNEVIINQEAKKAGIEVSESDIDAKVEEVKQQLSSQGQELDALLSAQGISQEDFRKQIKVQIYLEKLLADKVEVTDESIAAWIESNKDFLPEGQSEEEKKATAREELKQQNFSTAFSTWLAEVKGNSSINYFVEY